MKILSIATNCCPTRKPAFKQSQTKFEDMPTDLKLNDLKNDLVELKDIGNIVIEQNNNILNCLDRFATIEYEKADCNMKFTIREIADNIKKFIRGGN